MRSIYPRASRPLSCALFAVVASACAGSDPLSMDGDAPVPSTESEASLALLSATSEVGGTRPNLVALPKAADTLAVGDSVRYVPTGSMARRDVRQYWYTTTPEHANVTHNGWVRALAVGTTTVIMVPQAQPYPTAFTRLTVVPRVESAAPPVAPPVAPPPPPPPATSAGSTAAELPRDTVDVSMPTPSGRTLFVAAGGNLQAALDSAQGGDVVTLQPGAVFDGAFVLPRKGNAGWIIVRTGVPDASLPAVGTRMTPARAASANLAKVRSQFSNVPAIRTAAGATRWRLIGLEITASPAVTQANALLELGFSATVDLTDRSQLPQDIVLDRLYIHGTASLNTRRCLALHSGKSAIVDSYLADCHTSGSDSQAIIGYNGTGPYRIENNYLEGAGMGIMFGGAAPGIADVVPSDIVIRRNHFFKPLGWKGVWSIKNMLELKVGRRVLIERNAFDNTWDDGQAAAILFKTAAYVNSPEQMTADVTFRWNHVRCAAQGLNISAQPENSMGTPARRISVTNNLWQDIGRCNGTEGGRMVQLYNGLQDIIVDRNTFHTPNALGQFLSFEGAVGQRLTFTNNIGNLAEYAVFSSSGFNDRALATMWQGVTFAGNVLVTQRTDWAASFPAGNAFPAGWDAVGFANLAGGDLRLGSSSAYQGRGVDVATLNTLLTGVR